MPGKYILPTWDILAHCLPNRILSSTYRSNELQQMPIRILLHIWNIEFVSSRLLLLVIKFNTFLSLIYYN